MRSGVQFLCPGEAPRRNPPLVFGSEVSANEYIELRMGLLGGRPTSGWIEDETDGNRQFRTYHVAGLGDMIVCMTAERW